MPSMPSYTFTPLREVLLARAVCRDLRYWSDHTSQEARGRIVRVQHHSADIFTCVQGCCHDCFAVSEFSRKLERPGSPWTYATVFRRVRSGDVG